MSSADKYATNPLEKTMVLSGGFLMHPISEERGLHSPNFKYLFNAWRKEIQFAERAHGAQGFKGVLIRVYGKLIDSSDPIYVAERVVSLVVKLDRNKNERDARILLEWSLEAVKLDSTREAMAALCLKSLIEEGTDSTWIDDWVSKRFKSTSSQWNILEKTWSLLGASRERDIKRAPMREGALIGLVRLRTDAYKEQAEIADHIDLMRRCTGAAEPKEEGVEGVNILSSAVKDSHTDQRRRVRL